MSIRERRAEVVDVLCQALLTKLVADAGGRRPTATQSTTDATNERRRS